MTSLRHRFPGIGPEWARFDGPAGTQMVDSAITAMSDWMASGNTASNGGPFAAAEECQRLIDRTRAGRRPTPGGGSAWHQLRPQHDIADVRGVAGDRRDVASRRQDRGNKARPRRQHHAVAPGGRRSRGTTGAGALRPAHRATAARQRHRPHRRTHEVGHAARSIEPARLDARSRPDHRGRPCSRRQRLHRRRAPRPASQDRHRRARLRRARDLAIQVVRPAQRSAVDATRVAREPPGVQGPPRGRSRAVAHRNRDAELRGHRRYRSCRSLPDRGGHGPTRRGRVGGVLALCSKVCSPSTA